jgi:hypothetical protein
MMRLDCIGMGRDGEARLYRDGERRRERGDWYKELNIADFLETELEKMKETEESSDVLQDNKQEKKGRETE